jgi:hypothetical protein
MPDPGPPDWKRLGALLAERRREMDPRYQFRPVFAVERAISVRTLVSIEGGQPAKTPLMLARLETVYALRSGSLVRTLAGGALEPLDLDGGDVDGGEAYRAEVLAAAVAAVTGPAEERIRLEIRTRGRRANARTIFADHAEQAIWSRIDLPEELRIRQIAVLRLLADAASGTPARRAM